LICVSARDKKEHMSTVTVFRKLAPFVWTKPSAAATYSVVTVDVSAWETYLKEKKISLIGLVVLALKYGHQKEPGPASYVSPFRKVKMKNDFAVSIMTPHKGEDLSFITLKDLHLKKNAEILSDLNSAIGNFDKIGYASQFGKAYAILDYIPHWMLFFVFPIIRFLIHRVKVPWLPYRPFGDIIISNVGSLGFDSALLPLTPLARASVMLSIGKLNQNKVQLGFTMDHRLMDGFHAKRFMDGFLPVFKNNPESLL
jgi:hypothetical protein